MLHYCRHPRAVPVHSDEQGECRAVGAAALGSRPARSPRQWFSLIFIYTLPFAFVSELGFWAPLSTCILAVGYFGLDCIATTLEDPFAPDSSGLPMEDIIVGVEETTRSIHELDSRAYQHRIDWVSTIDSDALVDVNRAGMCAFLDVTAEKLGKAIAREREGGS